jgi:hypothetical protein
MYLDLNAQHV